MRGGGIPLHRLSEPLGDSVRWFVAQRATRPGDVRERARNVSRSEILVDRFGRSQCRAVLRKQVAHQIEQARERGRISARDVVGSISRLSWRAGRGKEIRLYHVVDVAEVAACLSIAVDAT